jgi:carbamoyl-phosphate synthase large subunit
MLATIIERERPDALLPTMGGQTALNCALDLAREGVLNKFDVELIGATKKAIDKAEDREKFKAAMTRIGPRLGALGHRAQPGAGARRAGDDRLPGRAAAVVHAGGTGGGIAYNKDEFVEMVNRGPRPVAHARAADRGVALGWKEFEMEVGARQEGQLHHRVLDREPRPDGRAHRRLDHRGAGADADRQGIPDHARRVDRGAARVGVDTGGSNVQFAINPADGRMVVIEMNPRVSRSSALASKATGFPIAKVAAKLAVGYTLDELRNDITGGRRRRRSSRRSTTSSPRCRASRSRSSSRPTTG